MTCIVGYLDKKNNCSWIGCDSLGSNGYSKQVQLNAKAFHNKVLQNVIMGGTSTFRHLDLLEFSEGLFDEVDKYKTPEIDREYMVTKFIPKLRKVFNDGIYSDEQKENGGNFIFATNDKVFEVQSDYSILEPEDGFVAVGCGENFALGSLSSTKNIEEIPIEKRIEMALIAAEAYSCGVQRPFKIINSKNNEVIVID